MAASVFASYAPRENPKKDSADAKIARLSKMPTIYKYFVAKFVRIGRPPISSMDTLVKSAKEDISETLWSTRTGKERTHIAKAWSGYWFILCTSVAFVRAAPTPLR